MTYISDRIAALRQRGWTLAAISRLLGVHEQSVYRYAKGRKSHTDKVLEILDQMLAAPPPPKPQTELSPSPFLGTKGVCADCGVDITDLRYNAKRCRPCSANRQKVKNRRFHHPSKRQAEPAGKEV